MLFSFLKCPTDSRRESSNFYGVPVTYGCEKLITDILALIHEMQDEFINKRAYIGADERLFDGKNNLPDSGYYKLFRAASSIDDKPFLEIFSPDIRHTSFIDGINFKLSQLEKAIGVNRGVLTDLDTADATATAIRRSTFDTYNLVDSMRSNMADALENLCYAYDVYATALNLAPAGEYDLSFRWSYSLLEDSAETWKQLVDGQAAGVVNPYELREFLFNEDRDSAIANLPEQVKSPLIIGE